MVQASGSEFITISNDDMSLVINVDQWNLGICIDGDYNSISVNYKTHDTIDLREIDFFTLETSQFIVEKSTISQFDVDMQVGFDKYLPLYEVKLQIHFHSPIIRDIEKYKKMTNRKNTINKILDNKE